MSEVSYRSLDIIGFPNYRVGDDGSVWSNWAKEYLGRNKGTRTIVGTQWRKLSTSVTRDNHRSVVLCNGLKRKRVFVHCLVLFAFVGPRPKGMEGCHEDGDPANNVLTNLRWDTSKANKADAIRHGRQPRGEKVHNSKMTEEGVKTIRRLFSEGHSRQELAAMFNLEQSTANDIIRRRRWKHVL